MMADVLADIIDKTLEEDAKRGDAEAYRLILEELNDQSSEQLFKSAQQGNAAAQYQFGYRLLKGLGVRKDEAEAVQWFRKSAAQGNADGQFFLGQCYSEGRGVPKDEAAACEWYTKAAAANNHAEAQYELGVRFLTGIGGVAEDKKQAAEWFRKAAEQGHAFAQCELGVCLLKGECVTKDEAAAVVWFRKSAAQKTSFGPYALAECYLNGRGVTKNEEVAAEWMRKAAEQGHGTARAYINQAIAKSKRAAERGDPVAQYSLGLWLAADVPYADKETAAKWFRKAAEQGHAAAQCTFGKCLRDGVGVPKDEAAAAEWFRKSAAQNNANAQFALGQCYDDGAGLLKNKFAAWEWFSKAGKHAHSQAQLRLAFKLEHGSGVAKDDITAFGLYQKASNSEDQDVADAARVEVARCLLRGIGVTQDEREAVKRLRELADAGSLGALHLLVECMLAGKPKNETKAAELLEKAARGGFVDSQFAFAQCLMKGKGLPRSEAAAQLWFDKAAEHGHAGSQFMLGVCFQFGSSSIADPLRVLQHPQRLHGPPSRTIRRQQLRLALSACQLPSTQQTRKARLRNVVELSWPA